MSQSFLILVNLLVISSLSFLIWRRDRQKVFWLALGAKLSCGILIGLLYRYYYTTGDTWTFFYEGRRVVNSLKTHPTSALDFYWQDELPAGVSDVDSRPRSLYFMKWVAIFNSIDGNNYWITSLYMSIVAFFGSWYLYRILAQQFPSIKPEIIITTLFMPSVVLWGSGVIKESLAIGFLFLLTGIFVDWYFRRTLSALKIIAVLFSAWILWNLKYYWLAAWLAVVIPVVVISLLESKIQWIKQNPKLSWLIFLLMSVVVISLLHPNFYYYRFFYVIVDNYRAYVELSEPDDFIHFYDLQATLGSILVNAPWAFISGLFRPFIFEADNLLKAVAALENLVTLLLFVMTVYRFKEFRNEFNLLHMALVFYIIFLSVFLTLSTPNFGTLSRYKIGFTPFLWLGLLSASRVLFRFPNLRNQFPAP